MPHLFGWDTINPKVGGKERSEADQSHSGGVSGAAASVPVSSLLPGDLRAVTTTGMVNLSAVFTKLLCCPVRDLRHFRVTRKYRDGRVIWWKGGCWVGVEVGDWRRVGWGESFIWRWTPIVYLFFAFLNRSIWDFALVSDAFSFSFLVDLQWNNGGQRESNHWKRRA